MKLDWRVSETATVLHVTATIARGLPLSDPRITQAVESAAVAIQNELGQVDLPNKDVWSALCASACQFADVGDAVRAAWPIADQGEANAHQERIIRLLTEARAGIRRVLPDLEGELRHRSRPLREQWEARGPGFLQSLREGTDSRLCLEQAAAFVLHPVLGGGGGIDPLHSSVRIEALLANTVPGLPEVVRLGWLLAQLACHRVLKALTRPPTRRQFSAIELAMVPATLAAAETVELVECRAEIVRNAIVAWQLATDDDTPAVENKAKKVWDWWQSRQTSTPWDVAVFELAERL